MNTGRLIVSAMAALLLYAIASRPAEARAPNIRKISAWKNEGGEKTFASPLSLARDPKSGELVVSNFEAGEVVILDRGGALVKRLGPESGLVTPYGVAIDREGRIYVTEVRTGRLKIFSPGGLPVDDIDLSEAAGRIVHPGRIMLDAAGDMYMADLNGNQIVVFNGSGDYLRARGSFDYLQKAGPTSAGTVIGVSSYGNAVKVYDKAGTLLHSFGRHGDDSAKNISFPTGFALDSKGRIWLADAFQHRLKVFSLEGEFLFNFGKFEETTESGGFFFPVDLCFGDGGMLFVLEKGAERIQVFQVDDLKD